MVSIEQTIQQQRTDIAQAQQQASQISQQQQLTRSQLLSPQQGLASRAQRKAQAQIRRKASQQRARQIKEQQERFEAQVAKVAPQYAQPQYLEASYAKARKEIQGKVDVLSSQLASKQKSRSRAMAVGDAGAIRSSESDIELLQAELGSYQISLSGSKAKVVKDYYSGRTEALASYKRSATESRATQSEQQRAFAQAQGFKTYAQLKKAVEAQQLAPVISGVKVEAPQKTYVVAPPGYWNEQILETFSSYEKQIPESERRKMTQYEIASMVTSDPSYQRELQKIQSQKDVQESMKRVATIRKYPTPEKYGEVRAVPIKELTFEQKPFKFEGEVYDPRTGTFQAPVYGTGAGGTSYVRTPTVGEQVRIQAAQDRGSWERTGQPIVRGVLGGVQKFIESKPVGGVLDAPVRDIVRGPLPALSPIGIIAPSLAPDITIGESLTYPAKGIEFVAETAGEGWTDIYGTALKNIPKKNWPGKWIGGEYEIKPEKGTKAWADAIDAGKVIPLTKEKFGKGVETAIKLGTYAVPIVGGAYMGSGFFKGAETVRHPEKEAESIFQKEILKPYEERYVEAGKTLEKGFELEPKLTTEELRKEYLPGIIEQVKFGGAVEAGTSLFFLGAIGGVKAVKGIRKVVVPKKELFGMTEKQWAKHLEALEKSKVGLSEIEKEAAKIARERYKFTRGEVGYDPITGQPLPLTIKTNLETITQGLELTLKEKKVITALVDKMQFSKLTSKEIKMLTDVSKGRINLETQLPTKFSLMVGSLGDVPKVVEVSALKYSPWIGKSTAKIESMGLGIKGEKYAKEFQWVYQKGSRGKPLKETVEFQIVTAPEKVSKYSKIDVIKEARKRVRKVKTPAGDIYVSYDAPLKLPGSTVAKIQKSKIINLEGDISVRVSAIEYKGIDPLKRAKSIDFLKTSPEAELEKLITKQYSKEELKILFDKGTTIEKQNIIEVMMKGKEVKDVPKLILELQKENPMLALKLQQTIKKPYVSVAKGISAGVSPFQIKIPEIPKPSGYVGPKDIKKTPWSKTFGEPSRAVEVSKIDSGAQVLEIKTESPLKVILEPTTKIPIPSKVKFYPEKVDVVKRVGRQLKTDGKTFEETLKKIPTDFDRESGEAIIRIPRMVGGGEEVVSEYWGKGTYEVTEVQPEFMPSVTMPTMGVPDVRPVVDTAVRLGAGLKDEVEVSERFRYKSDLGLKGVDVLKFEEPQISEEKLITKGLVIPREVQISRERLVPKERLVPREMFVSEQAFRQRQVPRQVLRQVPRQVLRQVPRVKLRPKPKPKIKTTPVKISPRVPLKKPTPKQGYTYEIRRKGKWERGKVPYAFATKEGAEAYAQKKVLKEAAASYKVVKAKKGKKVIRTRLKVSPYNKVLFRKAKKEPGVMVQKKLLRILSEGEKKEISYAGGIARMKKSETSFYKQLTKKKTATKTKKKLTKKKEGKK